MVSVSLAVGLDYHQDSIRVCVLNAEGEELVNCNCPNSVDFVYEKIAQFGAPKAVAIEACCGAADFAERLQKLADWTVQLAHPGYVRRLKQSPDKSDRSDAYLLADLVRVDYLPQVWLAPTATRQLRVLSRFRQQLRKVRTEIKQQVRGLLREERIQGAPANAWTKAWLAWLQDTATLREETRWVLLQQLERLRQLEAQIDEVEARLKKLTQDDPVTQKLLRQPGVGLVTAVTLRAEIGCFERFGNGKQLARYCGVTPCNASSGKRQADAGLVRASNRELRTILIEAAHRLVQHDPRWRKLKNDLRRTKAGNVATAAVANRWIRWLYYQMIKPEQVEEQPNAA
jgi:transposase